MYEIDRTTEQRVEEHVLGVRNESVAVGVDQIEEGLGVLWTAVQLQDKTQSV